ncbi:hypothetical protein VE03_10252 [Pseudogymnoascus sp. 23342-1-I1]|nr:hypothetical protein VE03_10252 [Pseudogymnoascus sp. 23342-1-I1]
MTKARSPPLRGCNIALSGTFTAGTHRVIQAQLVSLGAKLAGGVTKSTSHLVTTRLDYDKPSVKVKKAREINLVITSYEWLKECLAANSKVPEEKYMLTTLLAESNRLVKKGSRYRTFFGQLNNDVVIKQIADLISGPGLQQQIAPR